MGRWNSVCLAIAFVVELLLIVFYVNRWHCAWLDPVWIYARGQHTPCGQCKPGGPIRARTLHFSGPVPEIPRRNRRMDTKPAHGC